MIQFSEKKIGDLHAAKVFDFHDDEDKYNQMVNREVSMSMYTKHPTIIKIIGYSKLDFLLENKFAIIIMELAKKGSFERNFSTDPEKRLSKKLH